MVALLMNHNRSSHLRASKKLATVFVPIDAIRRFNFNVGRWQSSMNKVPPKLLAFCYVTIVHLCLSAAVGLGNTSSAQSPSNKIALTIPLNAPQYDIPSEVSSHAAFSAILTRLLRSDLEQFTSSACNAAASLDFPNLRLLLDVRPTAVFTSIKPCIDRIEQVLLRASINSGDFQGALSQAIRIYRPASIEVGDLSRPDLSFTRLRVLAQHSLMQLYQDDPVLRPLLNLHDHIVVEGSDISAFSVWLDAQRGSKGLGFYPLDDSASEKLRYWGISVAIPSKRPILSTPRVDPSRQLRVYAPNMRGRSMVLIRCRVSHDRMCIDKFLQAYCFKTIKLPAISIPNANHGIQFNCRSINIEGFSEWVAIESEDSRALPWLLKQIPLSQSAATNFDGALVEYAILVVTN